MVSLNFFFSSTDDEGKGSLVSKELWFFWIDMDMKGKILVIKNGYFLLSFETKLLHLRKKSIQAPGRLWLRKILAWGWKFRRPAKKIHPSSWRAGAAKNPSMRMDFSARPQNKINPSRWPARTAKNPSTRLDFSPACEKIQPGSWPARTGCGYRIKP